MTVMDGRNGRLVKTETSWKKFPAIVQLQLRAEAEAEKCVSSTELIQTIPPLLSTEGSQTASQLLGEAAAVYIALPGQRQFFY